MNFHEWLDEQLTSATSSISFLTPDKTRYLFCLLLVYPLGLLFRFLPNLPTLKHVLGGLIGLWFGYFCLGSSIFHSLISSVAVYFMVQFFNPIVSHKLVFVFLLGYTIASHFYRLYVDYMGWTLDFTGVQMLLTVRLTSYAFEIYDGTLPKDKLAAEELEKNRLDRKATLVEYFGYVYFFSFFLAGPAVSMKQYLQFIDLSMFQKPLDHQSKNKPNSIPLSSIPMGFLRLAYSAVWVLVLILQGIYPVDFCLSNEFTKLPLIFRILYHWFAIACIRSTYYVAWLIVEGGNIVLGLGFSGFKRRKDNKYVATWENASNVKVLKVELGSNFREFTSNWNLYTEIWLRRHIYRRLLASPRWKKYAIWVTVFTSAFWHGLYPGYYLAFGFGACLNVTARKARHVFRPYFVKEGTPNGPTPKSFKIVYDVIGIIITNLITTYVFSPFKMLSLHASLLMYSNLDFYGHIFVVLGYLMLSLLETLPSKKPKRI